MNIDRIRQDFPLLQQKSHGKDFVYLDNAATTAKPRAVIEAERRYYEEYGVNIHRGLYEFSATASQLYQESRETVAAFIGAAEDRSVIFTHGSTESSNLLAASWGRDNLQSGDAVLTTELEHHSTLIPWQEVCRVTGAELRFIPFDAASGELDISDLNTLLQKVKMVVVSAMTNATGYLPPIRAIIEAAHAKGALVTLDAAQFASHQVLDVQDLDCDFVYFSAHKMLGPTGVGVLYGKLPLLEKLSPWCFGGDMVNQVWRDHATWAGIPEKFEAGTPNIAGVIGFAAAIDYLKAVGPAAIVKHEQELVGYAHQKAAAVVGMTVYGPRNLEHQGGVLSFNIEGIHSHDIGTILDAQGIAIRSGFHCAMPYMNLLGIGGTARASFYLYTSKNDIDRLFDGIVQARTIFG